MTEKTKKMKKTKTLRRMTDNSLTDADKAIIGDLGDFEEILSDGDVPF